MWQIIILIILLAALIIISIQQLIAIVNFAPWVPSHIKLLDQILADLPKQTTDQFIDLGCGDGRAVILPAKKFHLPAQGVEISPLIWLLAQVRLWLSGQHGRSQIIFGDLYKIDLRPFKFIYIYGLLDSIEKNLLPKLKAEIQPGSYVISYNFPLPNITPEKILQDKWRKILLYRW